jgi:hypothetical protein
MPSTAVVANTYHQLAAKQIKLTNLMPFTDWLPRKIPLLGMRVSWNAIWHHRLAIEICCQFSENGDYGTYIKELQSYYKEYKKLYSTMPLCSNKSISHYIGQCALDCLLCIPNKKHIITLTKIFNKVAKDGSFTEGGHYSKYVTDCFDRVENLFEGWYGHHSDGVLQQSHKDIVSSLNKVKRWQQLISDTDGVMAVIGDGWHETVTPIEEDGAFYYKDMTIYRKDKWLAVKNHRQNKFSLHQHPHCDEILIAHKNDWLIKGTGMPSYKDVMAHPFKWRRPRNHFFSETNWDIWVLWRHRINDMGWSSEMTNGRFVEIDDNTLTITDKGKKTLRFPGTHELLSVDEEQKIKWTYSKFTFVVEGINIELLKDDAVCAATTYGNEQIIPVLRIKGENIITRITVND